MALRLLLMVMLDMLEGAYADVPALPVRALSILLFSISIAFRFMTSYAASCMPRNTASSLGDDDPQCASAACTRSRWVDGPLFWLASVCSLPHTFLIMQDGRGLLLSSAA